MAFIGMSTNKYCTPVSAHVCDECGNAFTLCPPVDDAFWGGCCLDETCSSYDESRDIDKVWDGVQKFIVCGPTSGAEAPDG